MPDLNRSVRMQMNRNFALEAKERCFARWKVRICVKIVTLTNVSK